MGPRRKVIPVWAAPAVFVLAALCLRHRSYVAAQVCVVLAAGWMLGVAKVTTLLRRVFLRDDLFRSDYDELWE